MIQEILHSLDERSIAQAIGSNHDELRATYPLRKNSVRDFPEFMHVIGEYYNHHYSGCVTGGGRLSAEEAQQRAKAILNQHYRKNDGDSVMAFNDALEGTNGGLRVVLDIIADNLRDQSVEFYIESIFDRFVTPNSCEDKVTIIREFITQRGHLLDRSIDPATPEKYAQDHKMLIRSYVRGLQQTGRVFRRL